MKRERWVGVEEASHPQNAPPPACEPRSSEDPGSCLYSIAADNGSDGKTLQRFDYEHDYEH
ncbi:MAG: hypothetical protein ACKPJD_01650, partial [Planctomycetaceae bacterium]